MNNYLLVYFSLLSLFFIVRFFPGTNRHFKRISGDDIQKMIKQNKNVIIYDVRTKPEYRSGHIPNAKLLPYDSIRQHTNLLPKDKDAAIIVYCQSGSRSRVAAKTLEKLGYTNIYNLGGIGQWHYSLAS